MEDLAGIDLGLTDSSSSAGCACCSHESASAPSVASAGAVVQEFEVTGMTCSHCVSSVTEELSALSGVQSVSVDLHAGGRSRVTVASDTRIPTEAVRDAVVEAGYSLV